MINYYSNNKTVLRIFYIYKFAINHYEENDLLHKIFTTPNGVFSL